MQTLSLADTVQELVQQALEAFEKLFCKLGKRSLNVFIRQVIQHDVKLYFKNIVWCQSTIAQNEQKLIERRYPELANLQKPKQNNGFWTVAIKHHCKAQRFCYFWAPHLFPDDEKPKKNYGFLMVAIKNHCKTQCFGNCCSPKSLSKTSPKPLQNRSKMEILKS